MEQETPETIYFLVSKEETVTDCCGALPVRAVRESGTKLSSLNKKKGEKKLQHVQTSVGGGGR